MKEGQVLFQIYVLFQEECPSNFTAGGVHNMTQYRPFHFGFKSPTELDFQSFKQTLSPGLTSGGLSVILSRFQEADDQCNHYVVYGLNKPSVSSLIE